MTKDFNRFYLSKMFMGATMLLTSVGVASADPANPGIEVPVTDVLIASPQQARKTVTGTVEDAMGPIAGANIVEKGTTNGTITDMDGKFTLDVSPNAILVVSFIGYTEQQIPVGNQTSFTIQSSGQPGSDGSKIRIRGVGTLNNQDPLVLIDGVEGAMDLVNPQDIESISVLKDAASSSIYGSRAANGVVLITTKKGKAGKLSVSYSGRISYAQPTNLIDQVTNYADYMEWLNESFENIGQPNHFAQSTIDLWREKSKDPNGLNEHGVPNYIAYPNTDWQDALFGHGLINDHNVSVNGGTEKLRILMSAGYLDNPGLVDQTGIRKYSLRANIEADVTKWLTVGTRTFASQEDKDAGNFDNANNFLRQTTPGLYPEWNGQYGYPEAPEESATANSITGLP